MRRFLIILNSAIAFFFLAAFAYTFIGKAHVTSTARDFAASKTVDYSKPIVAIAEDASQSPLIKKLLSKDREGALANEIADYHTDPAAYVAQLVGTSPAKELQLPSNTITEKIIGWKNKIRDFYKKVLNRILTDIRIFTATNLIAGLIACYLAFRAKNEETQPLAWLSGILCLATAISIYGFIETFAFYDYLFNWHMGWSYPAVVFLIYLRLVAKFYRSGIETSMP